MAMWDVWSIDGERRFKFPRKAVLDQIVRAEKKTFPQREALDFESELRKRNAELQVVLDGTAEDPAPVLAAYFVYNYMPKTAIMQKVCVTEKYRRQGIATRMLQLQREKLSARGCQKVHLWVDEDRMPARRLYSAAGFKELNRVDDYYGSGRTAIQMILNL